MSDDYERVADEYENEKSLSEPLDKSLVGRLVKDWLEDSYGVSFRTAGFKPTQTEVDVLAGQVMLELEQRKKELLFPDGFPAETPINCTFSDVVDIVADVWETSGMQEGVWNEDDVRLAVRRVLT